MAKVFISYSHDSPLHKRRIHSLATQLRTRQLEVIIDQDKLPGGPDEGWEHWSQSQVRTADKVLIACTEPYCARYLGTAPPGVGLGAIAEACLIHRIIYNAAGINPKFRVILFDPLRRSPHPRYPPVLTSIPSLPTHRHRRPHHLAHQFRTHRHRRPTPPSPLAPALATPYIWDMANRQTVTARLEQILTGRSPNRILLLTATSNSGKTTYSPR
jgi:hypothetical protein